MAQTSLQSRRGRSFGVFIAEVEALAADEGDLWINEWHFAAYLAGLSDSILPTLGIQSDTFTQRVAKFLGRVEPNEADQARTWCFADTNVFVQYTFFDQVNWNKELEIGHVVLVVPTVVTRELDNFKSNRQQERLRKRARSVLPRLGKLALSVSSGTPAPVRKGVDLLLLGREPVSFPGGLDPALADDRLIAAALEFRWKRPGLRVVVLSGDLTVRLKAREHGLEQMDIPPNLECQDPSEA